MSTTVSVVIPTYRRHEEILRALQSVFNQSRPVDEIIVCNDGPDCEKKTLVEKLGRPEVMYFEAPRSGLPAATRNHGVRQTSSAYVALLDDDDVWEPGKIEAQMSLVSGDEARPVVLTGREKINLGNNQSYVHPKEMYDGGDVVTYMFRSGGLHTSSLIASRSLLLDFPFSEDIPRHEDWDWIISVSNSADFKMVPDIVCTRSYANNEGRITQGGRFDLTHEWFSQNASRMPKRARTYLLCKVLSRKAAHDKDLRAGKSVLVDLVKNRDITPSTAAWLVLPWLSTPKVRNWMKVSKSNLERR